MKISRHAEKYAEIREGSLIVALEYRPDPVASRSASPPPPEVSVEIKIITGDDETISLFGATLKGGDVTVEGLEKLRGTVREWCAGITHSIDEALGTICHALEAVEVKP